MRHVTVRAGVAAAARRSAGPTPTMQAFIICMRMSRYIFPTEPCVLRTFGHDGKLKTCAQSVPKKFRDILRADKNQ
eukprot:COSAG02_NODE_4223_length_5615_cov_2.992386_2_plen_76_part_00